MNDVKIFNNEEFGDVRTITEGGDGDMQAKLRVIILERGMTQKQLAELLGITPRSFSRKMLFQVEFTYSEVYKLCEILDIKNPLDVFEPKKRIRR